MRRGLQYGWILFFLGLTACGNVATLKTARVFEKDKSEEVVFTSVLVESEAAPTLEGDSLTVENLYITPGIMTVGGIGNDADMTLKLTFPGAVQAEWRYQLFTAGGLAMSGGLGLGTDIISAIGIFVDVFGDKDDTTYEDEYDSGWQMVCYEFFVPLYLSLDISKEFSIYTSARYHLWGMLGDFGFNLVNATGGIRIGSDIAVLLEVGNSYDLFRKTNVLHAGVGVVF